MMEQRCLSRRVSLGWVFFLVAAAVLATVVYVGNWSPRGLGWGAWDIKATARLATNQTVDAENGDCPHIPGADEVLVVLKTGATEEYEKLAIHLTTTLKCIPNHLLVSNLESKMGEERIWDALAAVPEETQRQHKEFELYRDIQSWYRKGQDMRALPSDTAWTLDRWKFMPMLHHAWEMASNETKWFVFVEADTSLSWLNLLHWLGQHDASKASYFGGPAPYLPIKDFWFAHGGTGVVISRPALQRLEDARAREAGGEAAYDRRWEKTVGETCCGDVAVGLALAEVGVHVESMRPMFNGESPRTMVWNADNWCAPAITWHHVTALEVDRLWQFERRWAKQHDAGQPYLFSHLFAHLVEPYVAANLSDWSNVSEQSQVQSYALGSDGFDRLQPYEQAAARAKDACAAACAQKPREECVQWRWKEGTCHLSRTFVFGATDKPKDEHWESGWLLDRFKAGMSACA